VLAGLVMRGRAVRPGGDDDEVHLIVALVDDGGGDVTADLGLGAAGTQQQRHPSVNPVDRLRRAPQGVDLGGGLAHPQLAGDGRRAHPGSGRHRGLQAEQERRP
jgi:hypothetical protein